MALNCVGQFLETVIASSLVGYFFIVISESGKHIPLKKRVKELTVFINENPHDSALFYERGNLYRRLGKYYEAREDYDKALEIDPNNAEIYIQRGWLFSYAYRDRLKAIEDLTHAIAVDPVSITAYKKRAISYEVMGHTNLAIADLEHILQIDPSAIGSHWRIANILFESNRIEEAIERMHRFIKAGGDKEEAQEIITDFQKELEKKPLYRRLWQFLRRWIPW